MCVCVCICIFYTCFQNDFSREKKSIHEDIYPINVCSEGTLRKRFCVNQILKAEEKDKELN